MVPTFLIKSNVPTITAVKPYTPLELHGRDVYIKEGCYTCHSQMIRPFRMKLPVMVSIAKQVNLYTTIRSNGEVKEPVRT
jgi:cbb3-type cytochrome c oxidase subunit II